MIEVAALLAIVGALLSEADDVRPAMRALGLGTRTWEPRHQIFFVRFSDDEPHWRTPKKKLELPSDIDSRMRALLELLVNRLGGRVVDKANRFSPAGWDEPEPGPHTNEDDVQELLRHVGLTGWVEESHFLQIDGEGWVLRVEGWGESCISEGVGPWSGSPRWREKGADSSCPTPDEEEFLSYCVAESLVRAQTIVEGGTDGPPDDPEEWVLDLWIGASDPHDVFPVVSIQLWRTGLWQKTKDGKKVGFRAMRYDPVRHEGISGADSRQRVSLVPGTEHRMPGRGFFLTNTARHALDYYAVHDWNVLLVYAFDDADHTGGDIGGRDTEISVSKGELLEFQLYDENGDVWTGPLPPVPPVVDWEKGQQVDLLEAGRSAHSQVLPAAQALEVLIDDLWDSRAYDFWGLEDGARQDPVEAAREVTRLARSLVESLGFHPDGPVLAVSSVEIEKEDRGKGLGRRFVQTIEGMAMHAGCQGVLGQAGDMGDGHSRGFWKKMGYQDVPGSKVFDDTIMWKRFG